MPIDMGASKIPTGPGDEGAFTPSHDWQDIPPDAVLPPGLEIEMNMETGSKRARIPPDGAGPKIIDHEPRPKGNGVASPVDTRPRPDLIHAKAFVAGYRAREYLIDGIVQRGRLYSTTAMTSHVSMPAMV
jgi:hypothetical protein